MKKIRNRFLSLLLAMLLTLGLVPVNTALAAESYPNGGWDQVSTTTAVTDSNGGHVGTVYAGEGVTTFYYSGNNVYIEYSGSSGPKKGFVPVHTLKNWGVLPDTAVGRVNTYSTTYYSPYYMHSAGSVSAGEYVAILCQNDNWSYIEYNISGGMRKRAYVPSSSISKLSEKSVSNSFYHQSLLHGAYITNSRTPVYAGPNPGSYPEIGSISAADNGQTTYYKIPFEGANGTKMCYIAYPTSNGTKHGYVIANSSVNIQ